MQVLPKEIRDNIFLFVPVGDVITEETTREEIEQLFQEKVQDFKKNGLAPYTYIWLSFDNQLEGDIVVRVTICCSEYIIGIVLYDIKKNEIREWDLNTPIWKRGLHSFPKDETHEWYGPSITLQEVRGNIIVNKLGDKSAVAYKMEDFEDFLNGRNGIVKVERIPFLELNIVESLADQRLTYYGVLEVFEYLYGKGYWTYGGFKNFNPKRARSRRKATHRMDSKKVTYDYESVPHKSFTLTKDGKVIKEEDQDIDPHVILILEELGATIIY